MTEVGDVRFEEPSSNKQITVETNINITKDEVTDEIEDVNMNTNVSGAPTKNQSINN